MIYIILIIGTFLRILNLNQSLWLDEAAQTIESLRPLVQQLDISGDFQPPLYHLLLHFWLKFGTSEVWMRLLSVIFGIVTIFILYKLVFGLFNNKIALFASFFLAISPFHIWYSQEIRPYSLSAMLGMLSTYYLLNNKNIRYIIASIFFIYSIYLSPLLILAHGIVIFFLHRKLLNKWIQCLSFILLSFIPWLPFFIKQLNIGHSLIITLPGWSDAVSTPLLKALPLVFIKFIFGRITFDNKYLYIILVLFIFIIFTYLFFKAYKKENKKTIYIGLLVVLPIIFAFTISIFLPILAPQRVLYCLPLFYILIAIGIVAISQNIYKYFFLLIFISISCYSLFLYNTNPRFQRENWREAIKYVEEHADNKSLVLFLFPQPFAPWQYYSKNNITAIGIVPKFILNKSDLQPYQLKIQEADKIFLFQYLGQLTDPQNIVPNYLTNNGFIEKNIIDFSGVGFISIYEKYLAFN